VERSQTPLPPRPHPRGPPQTPPLFASQHEAAGLEGLTTEVTETMRESYEFIERLRVKHPVLGSGVPGAMVGCFMVRFNQHRLMVIAHDGTDSGWEHVSVSVVGKHRLPSWDEMNYV